MNLNSEVEVNMTPQHLNTDGRSLRTDEEQLARDYQDKAVDVCARIKDTTPAFYEDATIRLLHGNCLEVLAELPDASVDAVVTDPPYGLANTDPAHVADTIVRWVNGDRDYIPAGAGFMGKAWDAFVPPVAVWDECLRVLKPGGHALVFAGSRTVDLMTLGLRLAGFDIRDSIAWLYGSGFPKSLDVSKAIDKAAGAEREVVGINPLAAKQTAKPDATSLGAFAGTSPDLTAPATDAARTWQGWGTALKPAFEPVAVARKPLTGTVAANVLAHGTGALNIDATRIEHASAGDLEKHKRGVEAIKTRGGSMANSWKNSSDLSGANDVKVAGRWPANVVLDDTQAAALDEQSGESAPKPEKVGWRGGTNAAPMSWDESNGDLEGRWPADPGGGASRFFYVAKAGADERVRVDGIAHPTVKPLALMRWLVRLVTPPGGTVLEPFAGSGTTVEAALLEGFHCIAIERETDYLPLITQRIHRRRDPIEAIKGAGEDGGLFDLLDGEPA